MSPYYARFSNAQRRYVAIPQDIDLMAKRLLNEDRLFNEGVCRPERLSQNSQRVVYETIEALKTSRADICGAFSRDVVTRIRFAFDVHREIARLLILEVLQERDDHLRFCSPLHSLWFDSKRQKGVDIFVAVAHTQDSIAPIISVPDNPEAAIKSRCDSLRDAKNHLRGCVRIQPDIQKHRDGQ